MKLEMLVGAVIATAIFFIVIFNKAQQTDSDPLGTLIVSQAILKQGTIKLDYYKDSIFERYRCIKKEHENWYGCVIYKKNGHYYYYFPLGTSVFSIPFVALANLIGFDIVDHESKLQIVISAINAVLTFLFLFLIARFFLNSVKSFLVATLFWLGTSFASTNATALWSHNFAALFALIAIYLSVYFTKFQAYKLWPALAISLFFSYLCRPTLIILVPFIIIYIFIFNRKIAVFISLLFSFFILLFMGFSLYEFKQMLPDYYASNRLSGDNKFFRALYGNLLSPSRGLMVFSPILLIVVIYYKSLYLSVKKQKTLLLLLIWPFLHWVIISRFPHWWAGWSYGPRLMTDVLPGIYLLLVLTVKNLDFAKPAQWGAIIVLATLSIYINTYQGLFNEYTQRWNAEPNIDQYPEYLFDWRYPQFLHNKARHEARLKEFRQRHSMAPPGG